MCCVCGLLYGFHPISLTEMERTAIVNLDSEVFQKKGWKRASLIWLWIDCWSAGRRPWRAETLLARISTSNFPLSTLKFSYWHLIPSHVALAETWEARRTLTGLSSFVLMGLLRSGIAFGILGVCVHVWWQLFTFISLQSSITSEISRGHNLFYLLWGVHIKKVKMVENWYRIGGESTHTCMRRPLGSHCRPPDAGFHCCCVRYDKR